MRRSLPHKLLPILHDLSLTRFEPCGCAPSLHVTDAVDGSLEGDGESLNPDATNFLMNIWCWRLIKGYGLLEYCREKIHGNLATNRAKWNSTEGASYRENVLSMNHWGPGTSLASVRAGEG